MKITNETNCIYIRYIYACFFFCPPPPASVDHSRICLQLGNNDYINASLITVEEAQRNYILTQVSVDDYYSQRKLISVHYRTTL